jgi:hypothetical protein
MMQDLSSVHCSTTTIAQSPSRQRPPQLPLPTALGTTRGTERFGAPSTVSISHIGMGLGWRFIKVLRPKISVREELESTKARESPVRSAPEYVITLPKIRTASVRLNSSAWFVCSVCKTA